MESVCSNSSSHPLTKGGFTKIPLKTENKEQEKIRLYHLDSKDAKVVQSAKAALQSKLAQKNWEYKNTFETFDQEVKKTPYLLRKGKTFQLLSNESAIELQLKYGVVGSKESQVILQFLESIITDEEFVKFYNSSASSTQEACLPLINALFFIFSKEKIILKPEEVKTITLLAKCENEGIQNGALELLMDLFEGSHYRNADYGFGLKYLIDTLPEAFLQKNQLLLLNIFEKLSSQLNHILHSGKSVNHELDPLMAPLISVARATLHSGLQGLNKETKNQFYASLKKFYTNENYYKQMESLSKETNYLLVHQSLWTIQHLVRISSSEHKAITILRKTGHALLTLKDLTACVTAAVKPIPDVSSMILSLEQAYDNGVKAFGIKDIPRPWYEMLESTEKILLDPHLTPCNLDELYKIIQDYDKIKKKFNSNVINKIKETIGKDEVTQETEEFAFGFVGQLSYVAMDHQQAEVRLKALEILEKIFNKEGQSKNVRILILTVLHHLIEKNDPETIKITKEIQEKLHQRKPDLIKSEIFRQSMYPCLALIKESSSLLEAAKEKLEKVSEKKEPLPLSEFIYGYKEIKVFEKKVKVGGKFAPKPPEPIRCEELKGAVTAAQELHKPMIDQNAGKLNTRTEIGNKKETTFQEEVEIAGDFEG